MSEESTPIPAPASAAVTPAPAFDPRRRLRELLSVPERDRSEEQWDEIVELEIQLAPGNRVHPNASPNAPQPTGGKPPQGGKKHHRPNKNNLRRPPKPKVAPGV